MCYDIGVGKINRSKLDKRTEKKLQSKLWIALSHFDSPENAKRFWDKFLTPSEVTILSKRLAVFKRATENFSYNQIKEELKVGSITIARARNKLRQYGQWFRKTLLKITS